MSTYETIVLHKDTEEHIARITLNRPDRLNAINRQMQEELTTAIQEVAEDDGLRALVLTGTGRGFCSGADTGGMGGDGYQGARSAETIRRRFESAHRMMLSLHRLEKPTIAMVNGAAVGAGFDLAAVCDLRVGSPNSRFMVAYVRIGLFPGYGGTWLYPRILGASKALELMYTGDFLEAEEAHRLGLLNRLVPAEQLEEATMELARKIAAGPPIALRLAKLMVHQGLHWDLETTLKMAAGIETITLTSEDHQEGIVAFREKRKPQFRDK